MSTSEIIALVISGGSLVVSIVALVRDFCTRKKVDELTNLQIESLKAEKEKQSKAIVHGYIEGGYFVVQNSGEAHAKNVRCKGWEDWEDGAEIDTIAPHDGYKIDLCLTKDSPSQCCFTIVWDDDSGKDHMWSNTLNID